MSVINKMLQDLQQRQASPIAPAPRGFEPVARGASSFRVFWYLIPLLLLAVCWWYWATTHHRPAADVLAPPALVTIAEAASGLEVRSADETRLENGREHSEVVAMPALPQPADSDSAMLLITADNTLQERSFLAQALPESLETNRQQKLLHTEHKDISVTTAQLAQAPAAVTPSLTIEAAPMPVLQQEFELALNAAATQQWQQALAYLSAEEPVAAFPAYFALKAAVLQQQAEWAAALTLYRQLLLVEPTHAGWNLAAGISAQQLSAEDMARSFYNIAWHHRANLPVASQAFLQQQLSQMKP